MFQYADHARQPAPAKNLKRKRASASTAPPTEQDESEQEEVVSEDDAEFNEGAELQDSESDSDFKASEDVNDDGSSDEDYGTRKSPRKSFVPAISSDAGSDSEAEAQMIGLAIGLSKETLREEDGRRLGGSAGQSSSNTAAFRAAAAAESRRTSGSQTLELPEDFQDEVEMSDVSTDAEPLSSRGKGKGKGKGKSKAKGKSKVPVSKEKTMTMAQLRQERREQAKVRRKEKLLSQNYVRKEERALALKLGRKLTHAERTTVALHRSHPELRDVWENFEAYVKPCRTQKAEQPEELKIDLLPFQLESLHWMREQEKGEWHGGMLAVRPCCV